jgi:hypothetical protein
MPSEYGSYDLEALTPNRADAALTPTAYNAAAADLWVFTARNAMLVGGFGLEVTTAYANGGTDQIASLDFRPTHNSDTGRVEKATMTMNNAVVADGKVVRSFCDPFVVLPGQQVIIEQKQAGGTGAGAGNFFLLATPFIPEPGANCPNIIDVTA